jgi:hypothetical protein
VAAATKFGFVPKSCAFAYMYRPPSSLLYPANCTVRAIGQRAFGANADANGSSTLGTAAAVASSSSSSSSSSAAASGWEFVFTFLTFFNRLPNRTTGQRLPALWRRQDFPADMPPLAALQFEILKNPANLPFAAVDIDNFAYHIVRKTDAKENRKEKKRKNIKRCQGASIVE